MVSSPTCMQFVVSNALCVAYITAHFTLQLKNLNWRSKTSNLFLETFDVNLIILERPVNKDSDCEFFVLKNFWDNMWILCYSTYCSQTVVLHPISLRATNKKNRVRCSLKSWRHFLLVLNVNLRTLVYSVRLKTFCCEDYRTCFHIARQLIYGKLTGSCFQKSSSNYLCIV